MIYVVSDIHGDFEKYIKIFSKITENDVLFVLGDVIDRGNESIKILKDMMCRTNVYPILGNHEQMAITIMKKLVEEITEENLTGFDDDFVMAMLDWAENGGAKTLEEFKKLSTDEREDILEYLDEFVSYEEISVKNKHYILTHTVNHDSFSVGKDISSYEKDDLIWGRIDYNHVYFEDKILITGHTPVMAIEQNPDKQKIFKKNNHIVIDGGCGYNKSLILYCLDTDKEIYID